MLLLFVEMKPSVQHYWDLLGFGVLNSIEENMIWGFLDAGVSTVARGDECVCDKNQILSRSLYVFLLYGHEDDAGDAASRQERAGGAVSVSVLLDLPRHAFMPPSQSARLGLPVLSALLCCQPRLAAVGAQNLTPLLSFKINYRQFNSTGQDKRKVIFEFIFDCDDTSHIWP